MPRTPTRSGGGGGNRREAAILVQFVVAFFLMIGMAALVVDGGLGYARKARAQALVDVAALSVLPTLDGQAGDAALAAEATDRVTKLLGTNGVSPAAIAAIETTRTPAASGGGSDIALRVALVDSHPTLLAGLLGFGRFTVGVSATTTGTLGAGSGGREGPPPVGLGACSRLKLDKNQIVDSYDSRLGPYEGPPLHVDSAEYWDGRCANGTNCGRDVLLVADDFDIKDNVFVYGALRGQRRVRLDDGNYVDGDVACDAGCDLDVGRDSFIHGEVDIPTDEPFPSCDPLGVLPPEVVDGSVAQLEEGEEVELGGFRYTVASSCDCKRKWGDVTLRAGEIHIMKEVDFKGGEVRIEGDTTTLGPPILLFEKDLDFQKGTRILDADGNPGTDLRLWGWDDKSKVQFHKDTQIDAVLDVVAGKHIQLKSRQDFFGRLIAPRIDLESGADFHFDLATTGLPVAQPPPMGSGEIEQVRLFY